MHPYQQRVIEERNELKERVEKLEDFFASGNASKLDGQDRTLLIDQAQAMGDYLTILNRRIARF